MTAAATRKTRRYSRTRAQPSSVEGRAERLEHRVELARATSAPRRSTRPCVAGDVDDRGGLGRRATGPASTITATCSPSISSASSASVAAGLAGEVGRADRERAGALEQLEGDLVVGHPDRDRAAGVAEVPLQRGLLACRPG